jgi:ribonuclease P protein component
MALTFSKDERLRKGEFRLRKWRAYGETAHFLLLRSHGRYERARIAIAVRRRLGGAVTRNRMRRLIKEFFRLNKDLFMGSQDNLIKVKRIPEQLKWRETCEEMRLLLSKVNAR